MKKTFKKSVLALALTVALGVSQLGMTALAYDEARLDTDTTFSGGGSHVMYIKNDGAAYGAGYTLYGTLGFVDRYENQEEHIKLFDNVADMSMGYRHSFIIKNDGTLWGMGNNNDGQLGSGEINEQGTTPVQIMSDVASVVGQNYHTVAIKTDGTLWHWGHYYDLVEGPHEEVDNITPEQIATDVISATVSSYAVFYVKSDGSLWSFGQQMPILGTSSLGLPEDHVHVTTPAKVMDDVVSVAAGVRHVAALKSDGTIWVWGDSDDGALGQGTEVEMEFTPTQIMEDVKVIAAGYNTTYAIKEDGTLWAWGGNNYGQVGNGTTEDVFEPVKIMDDVVDVSGGYNTAYALKANGELWGWGDAGNNVLNNGKESEQTTPILVTTDVLLPTAGAVTTPPSSGPSDWAAADVNAAIDVDIVPDQLQTLYVRATTRAEFCALAVKLYETAMGAEITERAEFDDTDDINVQKMAGLGIVNGVGGSMFAPDLGLTREQAATILARLAEAMDMPLTEAPATFTDTPDVSGWATVAVGQMQTSGIMGGVGENKFDPEGPYTREQSIVTTLRLFNHFMGTSGRTS